MADNEQVRDQRREEAERAAGAPAASVREEDLEPHEGLRYVAKLFKAMALLLIFMLIAELVIGFQQDGTAALGMLLVEATRLIVFAGFLWGIGDMAVMLIESNHDLRAVRILLGRVGGKLDRIAGVAPHDHAAPHDPTMPADQERTTLRTAPREHIEPSGPPPIRRP
ncbi:MAG: hypothetical protein WEF86_01645 [Gemmatimonadota bacterium]